MNREDFQNWSLVHWSLVTGHWSLVTGHWSERQIYMEVAKYCELQYFLNRWKYLELLIEVSWLFLAYKYFNPTAHLPEQFDVENRVGQSVNLESCGTTCSCR